jgi:lipopolysaccharide export system protein LptC
MSSAQRLAAVLLALAAALSSWLLWQLREEDGPPQLVGPPRSDYHVDQFELLAFDEAGAEAFSLRGPRLSRHPALGTFDIEQPRLRLPGEGEGWQGRAERGWISADATRVRLTGNVDLRGGAPRRGGALRLRSEELELLPRENRALSAQPVTVTGPGSILRGRGLRADLDAKRVELLAEVTGRYEPPPAP